MSWLNSEMYLLVTYDSSFCYLSERTLVLCLLGQESGFLHQ